MDMLIPCVIAIRLQLGTHSGAPENEEYNGSQYRQSRLF